MDLRAQLLDVLPSVCAIYVKDILEVIQPAGTVTSLHGTCTITGPADDVAAIVRRLPDVDALAASAAPAAEVVPPEILHALEIAETRLMTLDAYTRAQALCPLNSDVVEIIQRAKLAQPPAASQEPRREFKPYGYVNPATGGFLPANNCTDEERKELYPQHTVTVWAEPVVTFTDPPAAEYMPPGPLQWDEPASQEQEEPVATVEDEINVDSDDDEGQAHLYVHGVRVLTRNRCGGLDEVEELAAAINAAAHPPTDTSAGKGICRNPAGCHCQGADQGNACQYWGAADTSAAEGVKGVPPAYLFAARLDAMAQNYPDGHLWDRLDAQACTKAAKALRALYEIATTQPARELSPADAKDAERYRWLRDRANWDVLPVGSGTDLADWRCMFHSSYGMHDESEDNLDRAVDAAIAASREPKA